MVSWIGVSLYSNDNGTGRICDVTSTALRPVSRSSVRMMPVMSPKVPDISRNWVSGIISRGICQAMPRSLSP